MIRAAWNQLNGGYLLITNGNDVASERYLTADVEDADVVADRATLLTRRTVNKCADQRGGDLSHYLLLRRRTSACCCIETIACYQMPAEQLRSLLRKVDRHQLFDLSTDSSTVTSVVVL